MATKADKAAERAAFLDRLTDLQAAAAHVSWVEDHGTYADGRLKEAKETLRAARREAVAAYDRAAK